jgi:serine protease Do
VINSKIASEEVEGIGFAIPTETALRIANDLMANGVVTMRPMLGIQVYFFNEMTAQNYAAQNRDAIAAGTMPVVEANKLTIASVTADSAAANGTHGGLQVGDVITAVNGVTVTSMAELNYEKEKCKVGDTAVITIERAGQVLDVEVTFVAGVSA